MFKESERWDMDVSLQELIATNPTCYIERDYKAHKYDECYNGKCLYMKHPKNNTNTFSLMIGIREDGFVYIGDGGIKGTEVFEIDTELALLEMQSHKYRVEWELKNNVK